MMKLFSCVLSVDDTNGIWQWIAVKCIAVNKKDQFIERLPQRRFRHFRLLPLPLGFLGNDF